MFNKADIEKYFNAEKGESFIFMAIGILGIIAAIIFFFVVKTNFYKGAAVPLVLLGLLLGVVGFTVYRSSDKQRVDNVYAYDMNPGALNTREIPRMEVVMKNFVVYRYLEIALAIAGIFLFIYFRNNLDKQFWAGLGIGLFIMSILALGADYFAEKRGHIYLNGLKEFINSRG